MESLEFQKSHMSVEKQSIHLSISSYLSIHSASVAAPGIVTGKHQIDNGWSQKSKSTHNFQAPALVPF